MNPVEMFYPVNEMFYTFQGEGCHMGRSAFFVRLHGCPLQCPWCDSAGTWHPDYSEVANVMKISAAAISQAARVERADRVVITGGEPGIFNLQPLVVALKLYGINVHIETSGAFDLKDDPVAQMDGHIDWVTVSPKAWKMPTPACWRRANEFKFIIAAVGDIEFYMNAFLKSQADHETPIWLHPEWGHRTDQRILTEITEFVKRSRFDVRAGYQIHKLYSADAMDSRSRQPVPLGGDPSRGF